MVAIVKSMQNVLIKDNLSKDKIRFGSEVDIVAFVP